MTHRKGEQQLTDRIEKSKSGRRYLVVVGKKSVKTIPLKKRPDRFRSREKDPFR